MCYPEYEDYYVKTAEEVKTFTEKIIAWKNNKQLLFPDDVLNMLIDCKLINEYEVKEIIDKKPLDISLPTKYDYCQ